MFRRGRRCLVMALVMAALALPAAPAAAAGRGEPAVRWSIGMELLDRLDQIGDWLLETFLLDGTPYIDPNGSNG